MSMLVGILEQGMIYAILALGVLITYRILDFPDLTVDSSFPLGAAVSAVLISKGFDPVLSLAAAAAAGALAGLATGLIHVKCHVRDLLSGIITMTALYSINLRVAGGRANLPIFNQQTIFSNPFIKSLPPWLKPYSTVLVVLIVVAAAKLLMDLFLKTKAGYLLRAVGDNPNVVTSLSRDGGTVKIMGLSIANALVSLAGGVMWQQQRFFDISMGTGAIVIGLASVIIGTNLFQSLTWMKATTSVIIGSILYKACVSIAIALGLPANDMRLITAALFLAILILGAARKKKVKIHA